MADIAISEQEVNYIQNEFKSLINKQESLFYNMEISWNSNPKSYGLLEDIVNQHLGNLSPKVIRDNDLKRKISKVFLRDFFYHQNSEEQIFRSSNINVLYYILYGKSRYDYLTQNNIVFDDRVYFTYSVMNSSIDEDEEIRLLKTTKLNLKFRKFTSDDVGTLRNHYTSKEEGLCLYIDDQFLKDFYALKFLFNLFINEFINLVTSYTIKFLFPEDSKLTSFNERIKYVNYWTRIINENRELYQALDTQFIRRVKIIPFEKILESVITFNQEKDIQEKMSINKFLPRLSSLMGIKEEPLTNIYYLPEGVNTETLNYLCVIGYDAYFDMSEQPEMLRYFKQFSNKLNKASITRIFSVPAKRKKSKGWTSILDEHINKLLYQYILINIKSGVETFVMLYDEDKSLNDNKILWHQDYVIRFKKTHFNSQRESLLKAVLKNDEFVTKRNIVEDIETELYFAYPERGDGKNMLLRLSSFNNIENSEDLVEPLTDRDTIYDKFANNIYIEHIYSDFLHRAKLLNDDKPYLKLVNCSEDNQDEFLKILNLNNSKSSEITKLNNLINDYTD